MRLNTYEQNDIERFSHIFLPRDTFQCLVYGKYIMGDAYTSPQILQVKGKHAKRWSTMMKYTRTSTFVGFKAFSSYERNVYLNYSVSAW